MSLSLTLEQMLRVAFHVTVRKSLFTSETVEMLNTLPSSGQPIIKNMVKI